MRLQHFERFIALSARYPFAREPGANKIGHYNFMLPFALINCLHHRCIICRQHIQVQQGVELQVIGETKHSLGSWGRNHHVGVTLAELILANLVVERRSSQEPILAQLRVLHAIYQGKGLPELMQPFVEMAVYRVAIDDQYACAKLQIDICRRFDQTLRLPDAFVEMAFEGLSVCVEVRKVLLLRHGGLAGQSVKPGQQLLKRLGI